MYNVKMQNLLFLLHFQVLLSSQDNLHSQTYFPVSSLNHPEALLSLTFHNHQMNHFQTLQDLDSLSHNMINFYHSGILLFQPCLHS